MPDRPTILKNLPIIPTLVRLIAKKMHRLKLHLPTGPLLLGRDVLQTIRLVPPRREDVEGDLAPDRVGEAEVGEFPLQCRHEGRADVVRRVVGFEGVSLGDAGVAAYGRDVDHPVSASSPASVICSDFLRGEGEDAEGGGLRYRVRAAVAVAVAVAVAESPV